MRPVGSGQVDLIDGRVGGEVGTLIGTPVGDGEKVLRDRRGEGRFQERTQVGVDRTSS